MILYVNSCIRKESRTSKIANALLSKLGEYTEVKVADLDIQAYDEKGIENRIALIENNDFECEEFKLANQFKDADIIVIAAPYWDLGFPAKLKLYLEHIYITGIVSTYNEQGIPVGLCKAKKLYYVTTAGGSYDRRFSYEFIKEMATNYFGIPETQLIYAENLDIEGNNPDKIVSDTISNLKI